MNSSLNNFGGYSRCMIEPHKLNLRGSTPRPATNSAGSGIACLSRVDRGERAWNATSKIRERKLAGAANLPGRYNLKQPDQGGNAEAAGDESVSGLMLTQNQAGCVSNGEAPGERDGLYSERLVWYAPHHGAQRSPASKNGSVLGDTPNAAPKLDMCSRKIAAK